MKINIFSKLIYLALIMAVSALVSVAEPLDSVALAKEKLFMGMSETITQPDQVFKLCLGGQNLNSVPNEIGSLPNLQELNISQNNIENLPDIICNLINIEELKINNTLINTLPECLKGLNFLKRLELSTSTKMNWDAALNVVFAIKSLEYLDLSYNDLIELPFSVKDLNNLKKLDLSGNKFSSDNKQNIKKLLPKTKINF